MHRYIHMFFIYVYVCIYYICTYDREIHAYMFVQINIYKEHSLFKNSVLPWCFCKESQGEKV